MLIPLCFLQVYDPPWTKRRHTWIPPRCTVWMWRSSSNSGRESAVRVHVFVIGCVFSRCTVSYEPSDVIPGFLPGVRCGCGGAAQTQGGSRRYVYMFLWSVVFSPGVRSPMNQATSYLDSSQVYGVDVEEQLKLRAGVGGTYTCFCDRLCFLQVYGLPWTKRRHTWIPPRCTAWMWRSSSNSGRESAVRFFYARGLNDRGHIVLSCLFVRLFVCLSVVNFNRRY